jgi:hypothetical protein
MPPKGPVTWEDFTARLDAVYWPSFDPAARLSSRPNPPADEPPVPDDVWKACYIIFPDPEAWLHNPVPQLGGRTPIEALKKGRVDDVKGCIMGVADFFLPDPREVRPWSEVEAAYADAQAEADAEAEANEVEGKMDPTALSKANLADDGGPPLPPGAVGKTEPAEVTGDGDEPR